MYIQKMRIENIRSIDLLEWELKPEECPGWHVLIGDNGSGKSTIVRAFAIALLGLFNAAALGQLASDWIRHKKETGTISVNLLREKYDYLGFQSVRFNRTDPKTPLEGSSNAIPTWTTKDGDFSVGYGLLRGFRSSNLFTNWKDNPRLAAHRSIFGFDEALTEAIDWLQNLRFQQLEQRKGNHLIEQIINFINFTNFLPNGARLTIVSSEGVIFNDAYGTPVPMERLSDGYRSTLSMTLDIIRQLQIFYPDQQIFSDDFSQVILPGVVLIDEVDAHLHPTWQKKIGFWFTEHFPNMQFIVTTHSPLVCQAAVKGSVWKLPRPGTDEKCHRVEGDDLKRLIYGNIVEAYSTELFGLTDTHSDAAKEKLNRLAELNVKFVLEGLTPEEQQLRNELRDELPVGEVPLSTMGD